MPLPSTKYLYLRCPFFFYKTQLDQLPLSVFQLRVGKSYEEGREVKCFNAIAGGEGPRLYVL